MRLETCDRVGQGVLFSLWTTDHKEGRFKGFDGRLMIVWKLVNCRMYFPYQQWLARKMNLARLGFLDQVVKGLVLRFGEW